MAQATATVRVDARTFERGVRFAKAFGGQYDGVSKTWAIPSDRPELANLSAYGLILVAMPIITTITVRKADGAVTTIERQAVFSAERRAAFAADALAKFGAEVIGWAERGGLVAPIEEPRSTAGNRRQRAADTHRCRGCGRIGDDGECGLGDY